eukprot:8679410-Lingulodinium_polyedra.AAC.1
MYGRTASEQMPNSIARATKRPLNSVRTPLDEFIQQQPRSIQLARKQATAQLPRSIETAVQQQRAAFTQR